MKSKTLVSAFVALALATGGSAFGRGNDGGNDRGRNDRAHRGDRYDNRDHRDYRDHDRRRWDRGHDRPRVEYVESVEHRDRRGAGPDHEFHRGGRLPPEYRHRQYVVDDWRGHHLSAPPRGYHWVQTGGDYVLVAIATGVILQLLLND